MSRKKKLQTYVSEELYKHLERSARESKTSVSLEAARLLEASVGLDSYSGESVAYFPSELADELQSLKSRVEALERGKNTSTRPDPSRRGRRGR